MKKIKRKRRKKIIKYIPELKNIKNKEEYFNLFEENYKKRYKIVGKKALYSSIALVYGEMTKDFFN